MVLMTFGSGESYYFAWSNKQKNLRIVMPDEEQFYHKEGEDPMALKPKRNKS